jgi:mRNA (2'-O-methyladenosine-N6-)-methyltransferase
MREHHFVLCSSLFLTITTNRYPKLRELIRLKDAMVEERATPPMFLQSDLKTFDLQSLPVKFDVVLIDPPLHEFVTLR